MKTQKSFFEQNGGTYMQVGDVLLPDLSIGEVEQRPIGKYGRMRKHYLKEQHPLSLFRAVAVRKTVSASTGDRRIL